MIKLTMRARKVFIGFAGWAILLLGIVMIPYPGPGWVVVFIGLSILGKEYQWARDVNDLVHRKYGSWQNWLSRQPLYVKAIFWVLTAATVVITVWLVNGYGLMNAWFDLGIGWLDSPFVR